MSKSLIACAIAAAFSFPTLASDNFVTIHSADTQATQSVQSLGAFWPDVLKNIKSGARKKIASILLDQIFGFGGANAADLSEEALRRIEEIIKKELVQQNVNEVLGLIDALDDSIAYYNSSSGSNGLPLLNSLYLDSQKIVNSYIFNKARNAESFYLTETYAAAVTLHMAITTELYLKNAVDKNYLKNIARKHVSVLQTMYMDTVSDVHKNIYLGGGLPPDGYENRVQYFNEYRSHIPWVIGYYGPEEWQELVDRETEDRKNYVERMTSLSVEVIATLNDVIGS
ncbi:hypothetical protein [Pseudoalteromonas xiamenensis]